MSAVVKFEEPQLPAPVARRGITEAQWRTLANNLFPGAASESVIMVWDYCVARKLDPLKKPCHIVPMQVRDAKSGDYIWRDVVMPGIYEYRTTATRTGLYLGHSEPEYGPEEEHLGVKAPAWCAITVYRWNEKAQQKAAYPVRVLFKECAAQKKDKKTGEVHLNDRWTKAPNQMLTKCTEAAALREAFPDELGGTHTAEEMHGQEIIDVTPTSTGITVDPRGDTTGVDWEVRNKRVSEIADLIAEYGSDEAALGGRLRDYEATYLARFPELYITVLDKLAADKIVSKANFRKLLSVPAPKSGERE